MKIAFYSLIALTLLCATFVSCKDCYASRTVDDKELEAGFFKTPDSIQTSVYWYWISDHISEEGVVKDLQAMKEIGIDRAFIGNIGLEDSESGVGTVRFYSEEWWKILHRALKTATELGIDIGIFNSPGWSQSGGPWVKAKQSMRYLAATSTQIEGGRTVVVELERAGENFEDVKVIAYPVVESKEVCLTANNTRVVSNPKLSAGQNVIDGNRNSEISFGVNSDIELDFITNERFTLRAVKIYASENPINSPAKIQVKENGKYRTLAEFTINRFNPNLNVGFDPFAPVVISIPATKAKEFRLVINNVTPHSGLKDIEFSSIPVVERYPEKTLAKMYQIPLPYWHEYQWRRQPLVDDLSLVVDPSKVIDLTDGLIGDKLTWNAPEGNWVVLRTGMLPTGVTNSPARPEARGLETDKLSKKHIKAHFEAFLGEIYRKIPAEDRKCWKVVVEDSYETGGQNFTDDFLEEFNDRYGYDPLPFLPVYYGVVVGSEDISDRFLWDMRRLVADKVAYDYVAGLREISRQYGLTTWLENYGHWGFPGEFLQYGAQSDEIGGEFWSEGELGNIENRAASSCAHIYGKTKVSAESFTCSLDPYKRYPAMMKQRGDKFFSEGVNNTLLHLYISQPYEDKEPGVNASFGNEFNRKNTWFYQTDLFIHYIKRVNFMLQQGLNVADVAYFIGEDAPKMTGITDPALPKGYQFDYINAEVLEKFAFVKDGLLTLPHGVQYKILVLPKLETMRPELLAKVKQLIEDGAVVLGSAPLRSPSLQNYPVADRKVNELARSLWSLVDGDDVKFAKVGKGLLINGMDMQQALDLIGCVADCKTKDDDPILYGHRTVGNIDIYFISNQSESVVSVSPEFRISSKQPELWEPTSGKIRKLPQYIKTKTGVIVPLKLEANESVFVVFRHNIPVSDSANGVNYPEPIILASLDGPWILTFEKEKRGLETPLVMTTLEDISKNSHFDIRHYSGKIMYRHTFHLNEKPHDNVFINLSHVSAMAKITINDEYAGGVWTPPYRLDISDFVREGENTVSVEVVTTWMNRLIGDQKLPEEQRKTSLPYNTWTTDSPLQTAGLLGPVRIELINYSF